VPTLAESGFAGFDAPAWWTVLDPAKTPADLQQRMNEALNKVLVQPEVAKRLKAQGIYVVGDTVASARVFVEVQMNIWGKVVRDNNIKAA
jgi:tripartite-type tricarboxylate transporter receptor subunit TctC